MSDGRVFAPRRFVGSWPSRLPFTRASRIRSVTWSVSHYLATTHVHVYAFVFDYVHAHVFVYVFVHVQVYVYLAYAYV